MIEQTYRAAPRREGGGYYVNGPRTGMDYYASDYPSLKNIFPDREQAERAAVLMSMAYQYGRESAQFEIRKAIGHDH